MWRYEKSGFAESTMKRFQCHPFPPSEIEVHEKEEHEGEKEGVMYKPTRVFHFFRLSWMHCSLDLSSVRRGMFDVRRFVIMYIYTYAFTVA